MSRPAITVVGTFPPPVHGMAVATESLAALIEESGRAVRRLDLVGGSFGVRRAKFVKLFRCFASAFDVAVAPPTGLIIGSDAGSGMLLQLPVVWAGRLRRVPTFVFHHSTVVPLAKTPIARLMVRAAGRTVTHVLLCDVLARAMKRSYGGRDIRTWVVTNGHVFRTLENGPGHGRASVDVGALVRTGPLRVGHLANLTPEKGFGVVADAVIECRRRGQSVEYHLAGSPSSDSAERELRRIRRELGDSLIEYGFLDRAGKERFFSGIDVFVFPSTYSNECSPLVIWEALHAGVRVISSSLDCISESAGSAVLVVDEVSAREVSRLIDQVATAPMPAGEVAQAARDDTDRSIAQASGLLDAMGDATGRSVGRRRRTRS